MTLPDLLTLARAGPVHFVGIGGSGMLALAELVLLEGGSVSGCDLKTRESTDRLSRLGAQILQGHSSAHVEDAVALVATSALPSDHPEVVRARERGLPVLKRAEALGSLVNRGRVLAVAGTHGKTSTTAMATGILASAGKDPTGFVGGPVEEWDGNLRKGSSDLYVVEADEYDRSFLTLEPDVAIVTNVEADHLDIYGDLEGVREGFRAFVSGLRLGGRLVACADDPGSAALLAESSGGYSYGLAPGSQLRAVEVEMSWAAVRFRALEEGVDQGLVTLGVPGRHHVRNALGAAAAARFFEATWDAVREGLGDYRGVERRFQVLGEARGVLIVDDYAHHPTEIEATLEVVRQAYPGRRLAVVFQPHLYSRTRDFLDGFGKALAEADLLWVTDVFPARERPIPGVSGELVSQAAREAGALDVRDHPSLDDVHVRVAEALEEGDVLVTMGAGSVEHVGSRILERLEAHADA